MSDMPGLTELQFLCEMRAMLDEVDDDFTRSVMQQMADEIAEQPATDHFTTMARYLLVVLGDISRRDRDIPQ